MVRARLDEVEALKKMGVWQTVPLSQCWERTGRKPIGGRWVNANKGDDICHNYRSRYGAQEVRQAYGGTNREGLSQAMPPIAALKLVISQAVTANNTGEINRKLLFMDVSKAYLHADVIDQDLYVELPKKKELIGQCGGTAPARRRDAGRKRLNPFSSLGIGQAQSFPTSCTTVFFFFIHGDDIVAFGEHGVLQWLQEEISKRYLTVVKGVVGARSRKREIDHDPQPGA